MSSLAELPELTGFFSYSREDDEDAKGALSALRDRISRELRGQLGRSRSEFNLWQDKVAIAHGAEWEDAIKDAIAQSVFFIPIVTPSTLRSTHCKFEFDLFLAREAELNRRDLIFPIHYIRVPALEDERQWRQNDVLNVIGRRQYLDWTPMRFLDIGSPEAARQVESFCANIYRALQQPWLTPQQRQEKAAAEAERRRIEAVAEEGRRKAATKATEDERHRIETAEKAAAAATAEEQRRKAAAALAAEEERSKAAAKAAEDERHRIEAAERAATAAAEEKRRSVAASQAAEEGERSAQAANEERRKASESHAGESGHNADGVEAFSGQVADTTLEFRAAEAAPQIGRVSWSDVRSWSYTKIAVVGIPIGIISGLANVAGLYGVRIGYTDIGFTYLLSVNLACYYVGLAWLAAKLTMSRGIRKPAIAFIGLYLCYFVVMFTVNMIVLSFSDSTLRTLAGAAGGAVGKLSTWLIIGSVFLSLKGVLKDGKFLAIAATLGAAQSLSNTVIFTIFPSQLSLISYALIWFPITAMMVTYGIRRLQSADPQNPNPSQ